MMRYQTHRCDKYECHTQQLGFSARQGKLTTHTAQEQMNERGAVRHHLTQAEPELCIEKRIRKIIENKPEIIQALLR